MKAGSDRSHLAAPTKATEVDQAGNHTDEQDIKVAIFDHPASEIDMSSDMEKLYISQNKQRAVANGPLNFAPEAGRKHPT